MAILDQDNSDEFIFAAEQEGDLISAGEDNVQPWKILIVDDDQEVHAITHVVLGDVMFENRPLVFLSAHSGAEAHDVIPRHPDLAVILLDVVMETDDAGLRLVHYIRNELGNRQVRIILRTGQPGQAPERQVIVAYDINDYKAKSELTAQKLFTATVAALRSYQHIATIDRGRKGLEKILHSSTSLFEQQSLVEFTEGVLRQLSGLIHSTHGSLLCAPKQEGDGADAVPAGETAWRIDETMMVLAGSGAFAESTGRRAQDCVSPLAWLDIQRALLGQYNVYHDHHCVLVLPSRNQAPGVVLIQGYGLLSEIDHQLLEIFSSRVAVAFDNTLLYEQLLNSQRAIVYALGKLGEYKDEVTGDHVRRIERWSTLIAHELQRRGQFSSIIDEIFCEQIGLASILHDVGKVAIPDSVLRKPGKLDAEEWKVMRTHAEIGGMILRETAKMVGGRNYIGLASEIAESHHEKFDGSGYPRGLSKDQIPLSGRIVAVADVYDALIHRRPYKDAWELAQTLNLIRDESGRHFDPRVVDVFFSVLDAQGLLPPGYLNPAQDGGA
ncbi:putative two-component system response regulator [uncultured Gammaproteobacteria bacterium]